MPTKASWFVYPGLVYLRGPLIEGQHGSVKGNSVQNAKSRLMTSIDQFKYVFSPNDIIRAQADVHPNDLDGTTHRRRHSAVSLSSLADPCRPSLLSPVRKLGATTLSSLSTNVAIFHASHIFLVAQAQLCPYAWTDANIPLVAPA